MRGFCNVQVCVGEDFVIFGGVYVWDLLCVGVCMRRFCIVWECICVDFVMCGCV